MNIEALLTGDITRLRYVPRFSNCRRAHTENVAEHSYFTSLYGYALGMYLQERGWIIKWEILTGSLLLHDSEEAVSGDFPRSFKYSSPALKELLDEAANKAAMKVLDPVGIPGMLDVWKNSKNESYIEGMIVRLADFMSAISYLIQEKETGNDYILEKENLIKPYAELFTENSRYDMFKDLWPAINSLVARLDARD